MLELIAHAAICAVAGFTRRLPQDRNLFFDTDLAKIGRAARKGLQDYSHHILINGQPADLAPSARRVSDYIAGSGQGLQRDRGIYWKGSLLNLLATSGEGSQYKLYVGRQLQPTEKGSGARALELIPAGELTDETK